jgi:arylsulfatase A
MRFPNWLFGVGWLLGMLAAVPGLGAGEPESQRLNIVLVLCDDLGYGDLGCYGHEVVRTPNIDRFAAESLKLTDCYAAAANCSPARAGLMTGRTPYRVGVYNWIPFLSPMHLPREEVTVAELLRKGGYDTCLVGKWHLNGWFNLPGQPQPSDMGFSHWFATQNNCLPNHRNPYNFVRNGIPVGPLEGYASHLVADEAIRWLSELRDPDKPFFLYVSFHEPHEPIATDPDFAAPYGPQEHPSLAAHHGNITQMDAAFGRLLETLDDSGLRDSTFILFTSDNGPALTPRHPHGSSGPLRSNKGTLWEGGIRVPGIVQWPGVTRPGTVQDEPVSGVDLLPTLCALAGIQPPEGRILDGTNVLPLFRGESSQRGKPLYWQFNYRRDWPQVAMRDGDWKLLASLTPADQGNLTNVTSEQMRQLKSCKLDEFQLYNLRDDLGETSDLSDMHPDKFRRMVRQMLDMFTEVQQAGPVWPEWEFPGYEGRRIEWPDYPIP